MVASSSQGSTQASWLTLRPKKPDIGTRATRRPVRATAAGEPRVQRPAASMSSSNVARCETMVAVRAAARLWPNRPNTPASVSPSPGGWCP